jgi:hypothetical protein
MTNENTLIEHFRKIFITIEVFNLRLSPLEKIVYTTAGVVGVAVVGALVALVLKP